MTSKYSFQADGNTPQQLTHDYTTQQLTHDVPALFIFGDSTMDVGNNNNLWTLARADYYPFGKDFDTHQATGRFTNGRLSVDYVASFLNLSLAPPYLQNTTGDFSHGVNFASAGSGILESTGDVFGQHISIERQVDFFENVKKQLSHSLGHSNAHDIVARSIYFISTGSNDYLKNYFIRKSHYAKIYNEEEFQILLLDKMSQVIQRLYNLGARKLAFVSLPPMGILPSQLAKFQSVNVTHLHFLNLISKNYNSGLQAMLMALQGQLNQSILVYNNAYDLLINITNFPHSYGFQNGKRACCGMGRYGGALPCLPRFRTCRDSSRNVFWDQFHPTSAVYYLLTVGFWNGELEYSSPLNVKSLALL